MENHAGEHAAARIANETERGYKVHHGTFTEYKQFGLHFHACYEILIHVRNGPYYYAGQQVFIPQPLEVFVFPPFQIHGMMGQELLHDYERMYFHVSPQVAEQLGFGHVPVRHILNQYCHSQGSRVLLTHQEFAYLHHLAGRISAEVPEQTPFSRMDDLATLSSMFSCLCQALSRTGEHSSDMQPPPKTLVHKVCCYINCHFTQDVTLDSLAEHFAVSKYHLSHKFSQAFGMSVYHYVLMCRITLAQKLIAQGRCFHEIAAECGFKDYSNFLRAFTKLTGISPSAWRKQHEKNEQQCTQR